MRSCGGRLLTHAGAEGAIVIAALVRVAGKQDIAGST
jgi:hypothetical protein